MLSRMIDFIIYWDDFKCFLFSPKAPLGVRNKRHLPTNWNIDTCYVKIGRPSIFGNPYTLTTFSREEAIYKFSEYAKTSENIMRNVHLLSGKLLVCSCYPLNCHGDFLLKTGLSFLNFI